VCVCVCACVCARVWVCACVCARVCVGEVYFEVISIRKRVSEGEREGEGEISQLRSKCILKPSCCRCIQAERSSNSTSSLSRSSMGEIINGNLTLLPGCNLMSRNCTVIVLYIYPVSMFFVATYESLATRRHKSYVGSQNSHLSEN